MKQKCWAHLLRDANELAEKKEPPLEAALFYGGLKRIFTSAKKIAEDLRTAEERRNEYAAHVERLAKRLLKYSSELFTFILVPGIEPTNNTAESQDATERKMVRRIETC